MSTHPDGLARVVKRCAWCGDPLETETRVVIAGGRFSGCSSEIEMMRGHVVSVGTSRAVQRITAVVPLADTPAHSAGYDLMFVLCSIECRDALDEAIGDEPMTLRREMAATAPRASGPERRGPGRRRPS
jgi:hypothetical protein